MPRRFRPRLRHQNERGFSLIIVFMLIVVMVGVAAGVAITTQQDLSTTGQDRESQLAFYAAEYAVTEARDFLSNPPAYPGLPATSGFDTSGSNGWSNLLQSGAPELCQACVPGASAGTFTCGCPPVPAASTPGVPQPVAPPCAPGPQRPPPPQPNGSGKANLTELDLPGIGTSKSRVWWQYCVHNDWGDRDYIDSTCASYPNGDTNDSCDTTHQLVIEADGYGPNGATAHLTVTIGAPVLQVPTGTSGYGNEGENAAHTGNAGALETGAIDTSQAKGI